MTWYDTRVPSEAAHTPQTRDVGRSGHLSVAMILMFARNRATTALPLALPLLSVSLTTHVLVAARCSLFRSRAVPNAHLSLTRGRYRRSLSSSMLDSFSRSWRTSPWLYSSLPSRRRAPTGLRAAIRGGGASRL